MLMFSYISWWYGRGWANVSQNAKQRLLHINELISVNILLRTLFAPWRRIVSYPGAGLDAHIHAMVDNLVSRVVGFFVRLIVLLTAAVLSLLLALVGIMQLVAWPLLPPLALICMVWGSL